MSKWYEAKREDLELDNDEINILLKPDRDGNRYVTVKIKDIQWLLRNVVDEYYGGEKDESEALKQPKENL